MELFRVILDVPYFAKMDPFLEHPEAFSHAGLALREDTLCRLEYCLLLELWRSSHLKTMKKDEYDELL